LTVSLAMPSGCVIAPMTVVAAIPFRLVWR
jgi:hypothetical protein